MKDNFSSQSGKYAKYRPAYPQNLFTYLNSMVTNKKNAWDCGTGNGQMAFELAKEFDKVYATDISQSQIDNALQANNIIYSVQPAEKTYFDHQKFDLIVVAQAVHWFDFEKFYKEVKRTAQNNALLCVVGYGKITISQPIDAIINDLYSNTLGNYWDEERKYIDENYQTLPFPFEEIRNPKFENKHQWNLEHLLGYLNTWSALKHFVNQKGYNPVDELRIKLQQYWSHSETKEVTFPLLLRIGKVN